MLFRDIGTKHRLIAFICPLKFKIYFNSYISLIIVNFSTDHNKIYLQGKITHYLEDLKLLTLVQHFVNCDSLVFQTGADLLLKVHFLLCVRAY